MAPTIHAERASVDLPPAGSGTAIAPWRLRPWPECLASSPDDEWDVIELALAQAPVEWQDTHHTDPAIDAALAGLGFGEPRDLQIQHHPRRILRRRRPVAGA